MNDLTRIVSDHEKFHIGELCEKLFLLQDKPMNEKKKALLVEEIIATGYPYQAIHTGLSDLMREDLRTIKIHTILEAIREKLTTRIEVEVNCGHCRGSGFAILIDNTHRYFSLACTCDSGFNRGRALKIAKWNGQESQEIDGRVLCR